ncbi:DUF1003 domain-containing protein [Tellurirhabdus rosea]|uniref:DUF1003 domain-containing protein n=1 Tax=Tellurirhabdus rosea TaxID=2674997 RepID=UPI00224F83A4|nr:DUF1003 domain-containing protein [Tellurirhabdus rosea]
MQNLNPLVRKALTDQTLLSPTLTDDDSPSLTPGERLADRVAEFGGSWTFIISFGLVLLAWISVNSLVLRKAAFDPYPYILLNLILSCLAAIQAPIIMMSQNRQETKDRQRAQNDYLINLKAEVEIRQVQDRLDALSRQQEVLLDLLRQQQVQLRQLTGNGPSDGSEPR